MTPRDCDNAENYGHGVCLCVLGPLHASLSNQFCLPPSSRLLPLLLAPTTHSTLHFFSQQTPKVPSNRPPSSAPPPHQRVCQARHRAGRGPWNSSSSSHRCKLVQAHPPQGYPARGIFLIFLFSSHSVHLLCQKFYYRGVKLIFLRRREIAQIHARISAGGSPLTRAEFRLIQTQRDDVNKYVPSTPFSVSVSLSSSKE